MACEQEIERAIAAEGQVLLGWRDVPDRQRGPVGAHEGGRAGDPAGVRGARLARHGPGCARAEALRDPQARRPCDPGAAPAPRQGVLRALVLDAHDRLQGHAARPSGGQLLPRPQADESMVSALAMVHQRFSTNTFPTWDLAHPFRFVCHNGEINTLRGNFNWIRAREGAIASKVLGEDLPKLLPLIYDGQSDSASFDNALELLVMGGYPLAHAMMMMIPEAWAGNPADGRGPPRVLRVPRGADGAVGRSGGDGVHGRPPDRRHARPQRIAARALRRHRRRLRGDGLRSRRARHSRAEDRQEMAPAAGQDAARRPRGGPHRRRRRAQAHARHRQALSRLDRALPKLARDDARARAGRSAAGGAARPPAGVRLHAGGPQVSSSRRWRRPARRRSARWATTPRCRCSPTSPRSSTTTSSSCSRRSRTRRSIRSARSW